MRVTLLCDTGRQVTTEVFEVLVLKGPLLSSLSPLGLQQDNQSSKTKGRPFLRDCVWWTSNRALSGVRPLPVVIQIEKLNDIFQSRGRGQQQSFTTPSKQTATRKLTQLIPTHLKLIGVALCCGAGNEQPKTGVRNKES